MNEPRSPQRWLWTPAVVALVPMALCLIRAVSWRLIDERSPLRMTPRGEHLLVAATLAIPLFPAAALLYSAITRRLKTRLAIVLLLMVVLGAGAGAASLFAGWKLFEGSYQAVAVSPDGTQEAHLFVDGLLGCTGWVYIAERGGLWAEQSVSRMVSCEDAGVRWLVDGGTEVTGDTPESGGFFWGPH